MNSQKTPRVVAIWCTKSIRPQSMTRCAGLYTIFQGEYPLLFGWRPVGLLRRRGKAQRVGFVQMRSCAGVGAVEYCGGSIFHATGQTFANCRSFSRCMLCTVNSVANFIPCSARHWWVAHESGARRQCRWPGLQAATCPACSKSGRAL